MNILFLCEGDPDRTDFGGEQRTHLLYRALQGLGHVRVLAFDRTMTEVPGEKMRGRQSSPGALARLVDHVAWQLYERWLPTCPKLLPFAWTLNVREAFPDVTFDLVAARYLYKVAVVRPWRHAPLWIDIDDHPLQVYETMCAAETFAAGLSRILDTTARRELESRAKAYADAHFSTDSFERQVRAALGAKAD